MLRLATEDVVNEDLMKFLLANTRSPRNMKGDIDGQIAGCRTGERRFREIFENLGIEETNRGLNALLDYAEKLTRIAIEKIPDGEYECVDWLDDDGLSPDAEPVKIQVKLRVKGSDVNFDFTGSGAQVKSAINNVPTSTISAVYFAIRALTGDMAPNNDGCYRPISVTFPRGSIVNPIYPAPVNARGVALCRVIDVVLGAMAKAVPGKMTAAGCGHATVIHAGGFDAATGERFIGLLGGPLRSGTGARSTKDGIDVCDHDLSNAYHIPLEVAEAKLPLLYHKLELWQDSGGAGTNRGGLGFHVAVEWLRGEASLSLRLERHKFRPFGIEGGCPSPVCHTEIMHADKTVEQLPAKIVQTIRAGEVLKYWSTGGGGYGSPLQRSPERVLDDVLNERVSVDAARDVYGVVVNQEKIDIAATNRLRQGMAQEITA